MSVSIRRAVVAAVAAVVVALCSVLVAWWLAAAAETPWAGLTYQAALPADLEGPLQRLISRPAGEVTGVVPGSPADRAGLAVGDTLRSVDGVPVAALSRLGDLSRTVRPGHTAVYQVERGGRVLGIRVTLGAMLGAVQVQVALWSSLLVGLAFLAISLPVAWARPRSTTALLFFLTSVAAAISFTGMAFLEPMVAGQQGIAAVNVDPGPLLLLLGGIIVISLLTANLLFHLALVFPHRRPVLDRWPGVVVWVHTLPFLPLLLLTVLLAAVAATGPDAALGAVILAVAGGLAALALRVIRRARAQGMWSALRFSPWSVQGAVVAAAVTAAPLVRLVPPSLAVMAGALIGMGAVVSSLGLMLLWSVLTCVALHRSYREAGVEEQRQVRWPVWGTLVALGGSLLAAAATLVITVPLHRPDLSTSYWMLALDSGSKLLYVLIPVSFAFGLVKHRLMEVDAVIRTTVVWSVATGLVAVVWLLLVVAGEAVVAATGATSREVTVVATLLAVALLVPVRNLVQRTVDRRLGARRVDLDQARRQLADAVSSGQALEPVAAALADGVQQALRCRTVALLGWDAGTGCLRPLATVGVPDPVRDRFEVAASVLVEGSEGQVLHLAALAARGLDPGLLRRLDATLAAAGRHRGETLALVVVGGRVDREPYREEEEALLVDAAGRLAVAVATFSVRRIDLEVVAEGVT